MQYIPVLALLVGRAVHLSVLAHHTANLRRLLLQSVACGQVTQVQRLQVEDVLEVGGVCGVSTDSRLVGCRQDGHTLRM